MSPTRRANARVMGSWVPNADVFQFSLVSRRMSSAQSRNSEPDPQFSLEISMGWGCGTRSSTARKAYPVV